MIHSDLRRCSRAELEALIEAAIRRLDILDGDPDAEPDADREPSADHEAEPDEASLQPLTLCPNWVATRRGRRSDPSLSASFRSVKEVVQDTVCRVSLMSGHQESDRCRP